MQVFLIMQRTDIPTGVLQVMDLWPNTSSKNYIYPPGLGQTGYVHNIPDNAADGLLSAAGSPPVVALSDIVGLSAYLIGNVDPTAGASSLILTGAQADAMAAGLVAIAEAGTALDLATVNGVLGGVVGGTTLTAGGSTGTLAGLLSAMAGNLWKIPAGTVLSNGAGVFTGQKGSFAEGTYKQLYDIGGFKTSNLNGNVSLMKSADFTYAGATGAAVTVYAEDGTLY